VTAGLYPTKTRLGLLRAAGRGEVSWYPPVNPARRGESFWSYPDGSQWRVDARMAELEAAGWVELGAKGGHGELAPRYWRLTEAGRKVLEEARDA
jgi:hypothetical protein